MLRTIVKQSFGEYQRLAVGAEATQESRLQGCIIHAVFLHKEDRPVQDKTLAGSQNCTR